MRFKKSFFALMAIATLAISCSRAVTVQQAANNHYKKCRPVK